MMASPLRKRITGSRSAPGLAATKPSTTPREPLTRLAEVFFSSMTCAPTLSSSLRGKSVMASRDSSDVCMPSGRLSEASYVASRRSPPGSAARRWAFTSSAARFVGKSLVGSMSWYESSRPSCCKVCMPKSVRLLWRTSDSRRSRLASRWRKISVTEKQFSPSPTSDAKQRRQASDSKQNKASSPTAPRETGGSWKKSPQRQSTIPPKGLSQLLILRATNSSFSKSPLEIIEASSMTSSLAFAQFRMSLPLICARSKHCSLVPLARPRPAKLCSVVPRGNCVAAMPVNAVTKVLPSGDCRTSSLRVRDFPVPAAPVKKRLSRRRTMCSTNLSCSSDNGGSSSTSPPARPRPPPAHGAGGSDCGGCSVRERCAATTARGRVGDSHRAPSRRPRRRRAPRHPQSSPRPDAR
mmetsp:Transcript_49279/g.159083  ORF Transcript_49279/g.159083 Transcript_49279/m.159083 type:complete len:409 (+) Transcript_49279:586-1812(+)